MKDINIKISYDLRHIVEWLRANKISLNSGKTEPVIFRSKNKKLPKNINFRISGQKINIICKTKYLGLRLDEHLTFKYYLENLKLKINSANCLLLKTRYLFKFSLLRTLYYALFDTHLRYGCQILGQKQSEIVETNERSQNKALRILNLKVPRELVGNLYKESRIDKLKSIIMKANCRFVHDQLKTICQKLLVVFSL